MPVPNIDTSGPLAVDDIVIAVNPFAVPSARVTAAAVRAGGLGVLDLTSGGRRAAGELALAGEWSPTGFGVRLRDDAAFPARELPVGAHTVLLTDDACCTPADFPGRRVLVEVTGREQALRAAAAGRPRADRPGPRGRRTGGRAEHLRPGATAARRRDVRSAGLGLRRRRTVHRGGRRGGRRRRGRPGHPARPAQRGRGRAAHAAPGPCWPGSTAPRPPWRRAAASYDAGEPRRAPRPPRSVRTVSSRPASRNAGAPSARPCEAYGTPSSTLSRTPVPRSAPPVRAAVRSGPNCRWPRGR